MPIVTPLASELIRQVSDPDGARLLAVNSGIGSGKSYAIAQGIFLIAQTRPGSAQLVSAGTYGLLMAVLKRRCDEVFGRFAEWCGGPSAPHFEFENGSIVDFVSYRMPSTRDEADNPWEGRDYHALWVDEIEQLPESVFDHSFQRYRLKATDINGVTHQPTVVWVGRPGAVYHWMEKAEELRSKGRSVRTIIMPTSSNHLLADDYLDNLRASMSPAEYACVTQETPGARMPVRGAIYSDFDEEHNVIDVDWDWKTEPSYVAIDFGVTTSAVLWIQERMIDGQPASVVVDEWCPNLPTSTRDLVDGILARGIPLVEAICDPAGDARQRASGLVSEVAIIRRGVDDDPDGLGGGLGCPVAAHVPSDRRRVRDGIARVQARILNAEGDRALHVRRGLWERPEGKRGIRQSLLEYEWDQTTGEPTKGRRGRDADHAADALRLYVIRRAWHGPPRIEPEAPIPPRVRVRPALGYRLGRR